jgi:hypothetical protein
MFNFICYNKRYPTLGYHDGMSFSRGYIDNIYINKKLMVKLPKIIFCYSMNKYTFWNNLLIKN